MKEHNRLNRLPAPRRRTSGFALLELLVVMLWPVLSREQSAAVEEFRGAPGAKIFAASEKGHAGAVKAMQAMSRPRSR